MANFYGNDPFFNNDRDDVFNQLFRRMDNQNSERARYLVNGQSLTPDEFAQYRATGKLPQNNKTIEVSKDGEQAVKKIWEQRSWKNKVMESVVRLLAPLL